MVDFDALWDYDDPAGTEQRFRALLPQLVQTESYWPLLTQLARTLGLQGRFEEGHEWLDQVAAAQPRPDTVVWVRYLLERGRLFNSAGHPDQAQPFFREAWQLAVPAGFDFYAVDAAHMLAIVASPPEQIGWNEQAIALAKGSPDPRARNWLGSLYNNLGWSYHDLGDYPTALALFEQALDFRRQQGRPKQIAIAQWCVARCLRSLGRRQEALSILQTLSPDDPYVQEELGLNVNSEL